MNEAPKAIAIWAFFSYTPTAFERLIVSFAGQPWAHCGVGFHLADGSQVYYESLFADGVCGPKPVDKLHDFKSEKPGNRIAIVPLCDIAADDAEAMRAMVHGFVGRIGYAKVQVLQKAFCERYGIPVPASPNRMDCSELLSRVLAGRMDLRDRKHRKFDEVTPASAWRRLMEVLAGYGWANAPDEQTAPA